MNLEKKVICKLFIWLINRKGVWVVLQMHVNAVKSSYINNMVGVLEAIDKFQI